MIHNRNQEVKCLALAGTSTLSYSGLLQVYTKKQLEIHLLTTIDTVQYKQFPYNSTSS